MRISAVLVFLFVLAGPFADAFAAPFEGTELLIGRSMKQPTDAQWFSLGADIAFSPLQAVMSTQKDSVVKLGIENACSGAPDPTLCADTANQNADLALSTLSEIPDDQWNTIVNSLSDTSTLPGTLAAAGITDPAAQQAVVDFVNAVPAGQREDAVGLAKQLAKEDNAAAIMVEPYLTLNFDQFALNFSIPLAVFSTKDKNDINLANINIDAKFGKIYDLTLISAGWTAGATLYLPTGGSKADTMGIANLFYSPKYLHQYLTISPYVVLGVDSLLAALQVHAELVPMIPMRDTAGADTIIYGKWGIGAIALPNFLISGIAEINGLTPLSGGDQGKRYDAIFGSAGVQFSLFIIKATIAGMVPLQQPSKAALGNMGGVSAEELAKYTVMGRLTLSF